MRTLKSLKILIILAAMLTALGSAPSAEANPRWHKRCQGTGFLPCHLCEGTGINQNGFECHECDGSGKHKCHRCNGSGVLLSIVKVHKV